MDAEQNLALDNIVKEDVETRAGDMEEQSPFVSLQSTEKDWVEIRRCMYSLGWEISKLSELVAWNGESALSLCTESLNAMERVWRTLGSSLDTISQRY